MNRLADALKVRPGEGRMVALLVGMMLFISAGSSLGGASIDALFFARFGTEYLPHLYVALGVVTFVNLMAVTGLLGRMPRARLFLVLPPVLALVLIGARVLLALRLNWFYPVLYVGKDVLISLQGVVVWGLAAALCDTRQAKRLFPLFTAGAILGATTGSFGAPLLVPLLRSENMLLVWSGTLLAAFALCRRLIGQLKREARRPSPAARRRQSGFVEVIQHGYQFVRRSPLMRWWSVAAVLFSVSWFSLLLPFSRSVAAQFPDADALTGFLGLFQGLQTGVALLVSLFLANRLFARFGLISMVLLYPAIYFVGFAVLLGYSLFPILVAFRFVKLVWGQGIAEPAWQAAFNVVPAERREQTRAFFNAVPGQAGIVLSGLILVAGEQVLQPQQLYFVGLGAAFLTIIVIGQAQRAYGGALVDALRAGKPVLFYDEEEPFGGFQRDAAAVTAVVNGLSHPDPNVRHVSAEILGHLPAPQAASALMGALKDPDAEVRAASLRALAHTRAASSALEVVACLDDPQPEVRVQAVETLGQFAGTVHGLTAQVQHMLDDPDPAVRARAALIVLRAGANPEAQAVLSAMADSREVESRVNAIEALGRWGHAAAYDLVATGLSDAAPAVRRASAAALMRIDPGRCLEPLILRLADEDRSVCEAAAAAIGRIGVPALERIVSALSDPALETGALTALEYLPAHQAAAAIRAYARGTIAKALPYHQLSVQIAPDGDERLRLLADSLQDRALRHGRNALRALGLLGERGAITVALANLTSRDPGQRAYALETLESVGERDLVHPLLRLWDAERDAATPTALQQALLRVIQDSDEWLRACAALAAGGSRDPELGAALARLAQSDPDTLVRDTAASTLKGDSTMDTLPTLSPMERILFLRRVPLFAGLSPADLKQVMGIAGERVYPDGELIAREGDLGDEMYIIVSGEVRVLNTSNEEVARRKPGEFVGEMAIISQEPRVASLACAGDVRVLCIGQQQFEGLLRERPDTSLAVMRVLCARLKEEMEAKV